MTDSDNSAPSSFDFGTPLKRAREKHHYSIEQVSEHLKIPEKILQALESADVEALPAQTFTQGYIRNYARYLEIKDQELIDGYNSYFPDTQDEKLKTRSRIPDEASSRSPMVVIVSVLVVLAIAAAALFGSADYYREKAGEMGTERGEIPEDRIGSSLDSPSTNNGRGIEITQNARLGDDGSLILPSREGDKAAPNLLQQELELASALTKPSSDETNQVIEQENADTERQDVLVIRAELGSWVEVRDANNERLFYNMVPSRGDRTIIGEAPFKITMGNVKTTDVILNDLTVDLTDYVRPNNTANFSVSSQGQAIIFH